MGPRYLKPGEDFNHSHFAESGFGFHGSSKAPSGHSDSSANYAHGGAHKSKGHSIPGSKGAKTVIAIVMPHAGPAPAPAKSPRGKIAVSPKKAVGALQAAAGMGAMAATKAARQPQMPPPAAPMGMKKGGKVPRNKMIQHAIKRPGALTQKADAAGETVNEFAARHQHDPGQTGDQSRFYEHVLKPASKHRHGKK